MTGDTASVGRTRIDEKAVGRLRDDPLPAGTKGLPLGATGGWTISTLVRAGINVLAGDLPLPVLTLRASALTNNIDTMAGYCRAKQILFAPHGKTTMAPQLFSRQITAGCWALTAATPAHLALYRAFDVGRIFYANQLVERQPLRWLAHELSNDPSFDFYCLADSVRGVEIMDAALAEAELPSPLKVLIEVGYADARTGCRTIDDVTELAAAIRGSTHLQLVGIEAFEGVLHNTAAIDKLLDLVASAASMIDNGSAMIVSVGGSAYFDRAVDLCETLDVPRLLPVLRSGAYLAHDGGWYDDTSPFGNHAVAGSPRLEPALELWAVILSRPQPDLMILGAGKRDLPLDLGPPRPTRTWSARDGLQGIAADHAIVSGVSDQHLHVRIDPTLPVSVGDLCACTLSHPCTAFDKWRLIPIVDHNLTIVDAVRTFF